MTQLHLSTEELLAIRDGEVAAGEHLASCPRCQRALEGLVEMRARLVALPALSRPSTRAAERRRRSSFRAVVPGVAVGAAASLALAVLLRFGAPPPARQLPLPTAPVSDEVVSLIKESQALEAALATAPDDGAVVEGTAADAIVQLEDQIAFIDQSLLELRADAPRPATVSLWRARVELLRALMELKSPASSVVSL